ncbi:phage tail protein, partial [Escherichia coli]|uniref:phage tail-collar fiber domain-containing protein n=1 Tax=Escherichia coli TaxID=562 RepID=UPI00136670C0
AGVFKGYVPDKTQTALKGEMARVPILSGSRRDPSGFSVLSVLPASSPGEYPINEIGFVLGDGTLFAVWSDAVYPLAYKTTLADVELGFDLLLDAIPTSALAIMVLNPDVPDTAGALASGVAMMARLLIGQILLI